ncbi:MAG: Rdx family protein [Betaproteobacteria bacterium]|nr:Rdx family protein [Betaproteobacteria bacterium]MDH5210069.1 Rdx family protein [Betaproteobacteria bacterium]
MPRAVSLAAQIKQELGIESELAKGANGVFDVAADGKLVFSKHRDRRYPEPAEIISALKARQGA